MELSHLRLPEVHFLLLQRIACDYGFNEAFNPENGWKAEQLSTNQTGQTLVAGGELPHRIDLEQFHERSGYRQCISYSTIFHTTRKNQAIAVSPSAASHLHAVVIMHQ